MPRRQSARLKNKEAEQQQQQQQQPQANEEVRRLPAPGSGAVDADVIDISSGDGDCASCSHNSPTVTLNDTYTDSPIKLDDSLSQIIRQIDAQSAAHQADTLSNNDTLSILTPPSPIVPHRDNTIFVRSENSKFGLLKLAVNPDSADSLLAIYKDICKRLDQAIYSFRLLYQQVGEGGDRVSLRPGASIRSQGMPDNVVLLHCADDYPMDVEDKQDCVSLVIQRMSKRREGMSTASVDRLTLSFPKYELLKYLVRQYRDAAQNLPPATQCKFMLDGETLNENMTAHELGLDDGDVIDCQCQVV